MHDPGYVLPRIPLPRTRVNRSVRSRTTAAEKMQIHRQFIALCLEYEGMGAMVSNPTEIQPAIGGRMSEQEQRRVYP
jgi:hypothetical protein